jgi:hypothetical protein
VDRGLLAPGAFGRRVAAFDAGDRTAEEFVEGDRHHEHGDGDGHGHGHGHGHHHEGHDHDHDYDHDHAH